MSFNSQMTALANVIRSKANIQTALSISGMIDAINSFSGDNIDITLGEIDQNGNFQPISFDGTTVSASGQTIKISTYYTWNNSFFNSSDPINPSEPVEETTEYLYLTQDYTGNINVEITWSDGTVNNVQLPYINSGIWKKDASGTPCLCSKDGCCDDLYVYLPNKKYYSNYNGWVGCQDAEGSFGCNIITFASAETLIPLNINLVTYQQSVLHFDGGPSSVIITKVN